MHVCIYGTMPPSNRQIEVNICRVTKRRNADKTVTGNRKYRSGTPAEDAILVAMICQALNGTGAEMHQSNRRELHRRSL